MLFCCCCCCCCCVHGIKNQSASCETGAVTAEHVNKTAVSKSVRTRSRHCTHIMQSVIDNNNCSPSHFGDEHPQRDYGMAMHPHWNGYRDVIDSASDWFFYGIGVFITTVTVASVVTSSIVIFVTIRYVLQRIAI